VLVTQGALIICVIHLDRFSTECRKTKTKTKVSQPVTKDTDDTLSQSKLEVMACRCRKARENEFERVTIGFGFTSDWMKNWREFFRQTRSVVSAKPKLFVDTQLETAP